MNTCENSFFGPQLGLGRQKTWSDLDKPQMWSCHIYFRKFALFILESLLYLFYKVCFIYFRKFALFILGRFALFLLGVAFCNLESFFS